MQLPKTQMYFMNFRIIIHEIIIHFENNDEDMNWQYAITYVVVAQQNIVIKFNSGKMYNKCKP